jgi:hypothetical protein
MAVFLALFIGCVSGSGAPVLDLSVHWRYLGPTSPAGVILPGAAITIAEDANGQSYL